ncbi:hypothetical protein A1QO_02450 [Vibrio genomosp. F10 str. ZF-129]|uniref:Lipoprotein n=1 Tax=Vibrio genomosp. F10 str. ZF-129 TaxID=1187848 RepID=A0A1E5BK59_9VIBR|nr:hypothetical protein [Vibrio genomosp. F10]OEE38257.1 hypothetical protein A1QO_02450 [Vibrio genomosp. F10 str. ZF-129]
MNRLLYSVMIASIALTGCNDDSSSPSAATESSSETLEYRAIDGYLGSASIYSDRNGNMIAEESEFIGTTDSQGRISVSALDAQFAVIVRVIAGVTTDTDIQGTVSESKELIAKSGIQYITPLSTLAAIQNMNLEDLAAELGLDPDQVTGDFIAKGHKKTHAINRSINKLLKTSLADSVSNKQTIKNNSATIVRHIEDSNFSDSDLTDLVLIINDDGSVGNSTSGSENKRDFNVDDLRVVWEQKDFTEISYTPDVVDQGFHPCYIRLLDTEHLIVGNCMQTKFLKLSVNTGQIVAESEQFSSGVISSWYIDGPFLALIDSNGSDIYLGDSLERVTPAPEDLVYDSAQIITAIPHSVVYRGEDVGIDYRLSTATWKSFKNVYARGGEFSQWRGDEMERYSYTLDGVETSTAAESRGGMQMSIINYYNALVDDIGLPSPKGTLQDVRVEWIKDDIYVAAVDFEPNFASSDHHFLKVGNTTYHLGKMFGGHWQIGLGDDNIYSYSAFKGQGNENHIIRQYSLKTGRLVGQWEETLNGLPANLYNIIYTSKGIFANSDSYSTVIRLDSQ